MIKITIHTETEVTVIPANEALPIQDKSCSAHIGIVVGRRSILVCVYVRHLLGQSHVSWLTEPVHNEGEPIELVIVCVSGNIGLPRNIRAGGLGGDVILVALRPGGGADGSMLNGLSDARKEAILSQIAREGVWAQRGAKYGGVYCHSEGNGIVTIPIVAQFM